jgi:hypothetical protein
MRAKPNYEGRSSTWSSRRLSKGAFGSHLMTHVWSPGDLGTQKRPGTSCEIEIHLWFKITQYLINGIRFLSQICPRHSFPFARHRHKVSNSFTKEPGRDKWLKAPNWISILLLVPVLLFTVRSPGTEHSYGGRVTSWLDFEGRCGKVVGRCAPLLRSFCTSPGTENFCTSLEKSCTSIDILYTLDSASNYSAIQKLKPRLQTRDIPMKWEDSYVFYFLNRELKH